MKIQTLLASARTKTIFPNPKIIFRRVPFIFLLVFVAFYVAEPTSIFGKVPNKEHWKLYLGYPFVAVFIQITSWLILDKILPQEYKKKYWNKGKSLVMKVFFAFIILSSFHIYTKFLGFESSLDFFFGIGLPLSVFPALFYVLIEEDKNINLHKSIPNVESINAIESDFLFAETHSAFMKRWNNPQIRRNEIYGYFENTEKKEGKLLSNFETLEEFISHSEIQLIHCHKSYCINASRIVAGVGNSKKFSVLIGNNYYEVPVSREKTDEIIILLKSSNYPIFSSKNALEKKIIPF